VVLVAGTGTDVGKTWVAAALLGAWRAAGFSVAARKPAQSYAEGAGPTDAEVLAAASGENPATVCPPERSYPVPMAPPMAADALGLVAPTVADLVDALAWPAAGPGAAGGVDIGLVETAGGVRSPQADDGDVTDVGRALDPDHVILVADAGLGTINAVRLSLAALTEVRRDGRPSLIPVVVLNRFDASSALHHRNQAWLHHRDGVCTVAATPEGLAALSARMTP
jgi:dethiobiotin synthetase